jgi:hypothetical protein
VFSVIRRSVCYGDNCFMSIGGNMEIYIWLVVVYIIGSALGYYVAWGRAVEETATKTLDMLESGGYLKTRRNGKEVELLKIDEL